MKQEDIAHLATLSRIALTPDESVKLALSITSILGYVSDIEEITGNTENTKHVGPVHNVFREDSHPHEGGMYTEALLASAPQRDGQYVKVKKILENKK